MGSQQMRKNKGGNNQYKFVGFTFGKATKHFTAFTKYKEIGRTIKSACSK